MNKILLILNIGIAQYISMGFFGESLMVILRQDGFSLESIGLLRFMGFTLILGFLWAPLVDKIANGKYKSTIIIAQCLAAGILVWIAFLDMKENLLLIITLAIIISFISTTSVIASNALFMKFSSRLFGLEKVNAYKFAGIMLGHIISNGIALIVYAKFGWVATILFLAVLTILSAIHMTFYKENRQISSDANSNFKDMIVFFKGKKAWLSILFLQAIGICSAFGLLNPMLVDIGWELEQIGEVLHIYGMLFGFLGSLLAGVLISKFGIKTGFIITLLFQSLSILSVLLMLNGYSGYFHVLVICALMYASYIAQMTILSTIMMKKSPNSLASEYSIQSSANMIFQFMAFYLGMVFAGSFGYASAVVGSAVFSIATLFYFIKIYRFI